MRLLGATVVALLWSVASLYLLASHAGLLEPLR